MRKRLLKSCRLLKSSYVVFTSQVGSKEEQAERMISDAMVSHEFRIATNFIGIRFESEEADIARSVVAEGRTRYRGSSAFGSVTSLGAS
jgi:hypothetical protein